jgi:hypothetical protein
MMVNLMIEGVCELRDGALHAKPQNPNDGQQYYVMHPRLQAVARKNLTEGI